MNPTPDKDAVLARFKDGPRLLEQALDGLQDAELDVTPAGGGWSIRQIVHHVVDGDDIWKTGIKAALGDTVGEYSFDWYGSLPQQDWAERWWYARRPLDTAIELFRAMRRHVVELLERAPDAWSRTIGVRLPSGTVETMSVGFIVNLQADHVEHHVARILAIRKESGGAKQ